jgi:hypothetical protein
MADVSALTHDDIMQALSQSFDLSRVAVASVGNLKKAITV